MKESKDYVGDASQYFINFLAILANQHSIDEIKLISQAAAQRREYEINRFENYNITESKNCLIIDADSANYIKAVQAEHERLLIAMFHYGAHRQIMLELSQYDILSTFPFAKNAYADTIELMQKHSEQRGACYELLNVEDRRVGLKLARAIKRKRLGIIYVDGNLGPEGPQLNDEELSVHFFHRKIRVKSGIARLAHSCDAAILPVFAGAAQDPFLRFGKIIMSPRIKGNKLSDSEFSQFACSTMQEIYFQLEDVVRYSPENWEFAFCLHRWLLPQKEEAVTKPVSLEYDLCVKVNQQRFVPYQTGTYWYFVDVITQKAIVLPEWAYPLAEAFTKHTILSVQELYKLLDKETDHIDSVLHELCRRGVLQNSSVKEALL